MIVTTRGSVIRLLFWQWKSVLIFLLASTAVTVFEHFAVAESHLKMLALPALPLAVVGGALGIFVSFRTNSAYDRWWEGRKLWGRMINASRHLCSQVSTYVGHKEGVSAEHDPTIRQIIYRHIAYVHTLRCLLRKQDPGQDPDVRRTLGEGEADFIAGQSNATHALLHKQFQSLTNLADEGRMDAFRLASIDTTLRELIDVQGGCERIKATPMPRGYGFIAERLILAYALMFPLGVVAQLGWFTIPVSILVCLSFTLLSEAGRVLEDPFTMYFNGLPLSAISRLIEVNLRQRLGETDLPPLLGPDDRGILM